MNNDACKIHISNAMPHSRKHRSLTERLLVFGTDGGKVGHCVYIYISRLHSFVQRCQEYGQTVPVCHEQFEKQVVRAKLSSFPYFFRCNFRLVTSFWEHRCRLFQHYPCPKGALLYLGVDGYTPRTSPYYSQPCA